MKRNLRPRADCKAVILSPRVAHQHTQCVFMV